MGFFAKMFGQCGTVRFEAETVDGQKLTGKTYVEVLNISVPELEEELRKGLYVKTGKRFKSVTFLGFAENMKL